MLLIWKYKIVIPILYQQHQKRLYLLQIQHGSMELWPERGFSVCMHSDLDLWDMTLVQGHDTPLGHAQQLCIIFIQFGRGDVIIFASKPFIRSIVHQVVKKCLSDWPTDPISFWHEAVNKHIVYTSGMEISGCPFAWCDQIYEQANGFMTQVARLANYLDEVHL